MGRRNAAGNSLLGVLLVIGFAGWVLSQIWAFILLGGALALVVWLGWTLAKTVRLSSSATPRLVVSQAPRLAPAPDSRYRSVAAVDPSVFDDPVLAEGAALKVFMAWSRSLPMAPANPTGIVRSLEMRVRYIGRLVSQCAERRLVWKSKTYRGSLQPTAPPVSATTIDPWTVTQEALSAKSRYITNCNSCSGQARVRCSKCGGDGKVPCRECDDEGKVRNPATNRRINCKTCKAKGGIKGSVPCPHCYSGMVTCPACEGSGRYECWLEIEETTRDDIQIEPDGVMTRAFSWGTDGTKASRQDIGADAKIVEELTAQGSLSRDAVARIVPSGWIEANWDNMRPKIRPSERIRCQTFWLLEVPSIELSYALPEREPTAISFEGRRMLAPPAAIDNQLSARARKIRRIRYALVAAGIGLPLAYLLRGAYYWNAWVAALALCTAGAAVAVDRFVQEITLGVHARRWAIGVATCSILACGFAFGTEPSVRAARRYISAGRFDRAEAELVALGRPQERSHAEAWADLHLAKAKKESTVSAISHEGSLIPERSPQRAAVNGYLFQVVDRSVLGALEGKQPQLATSVLAEAIPALQETEDGRTYAPRMAELQARVHDEEFSECSTEVCRWKAAHAAAQIAPTPVRRERVAKLRAKMLDALTFRENPGESMLVRLDRLDAIATVAAGIEGVEGDEELAIRARAAAGMVREQWARVALIGAESTVASRLLGIESADGAIPRWVSGSVAAYLSMRNGRCNGVYVVGSNSGERSLNNPERATIAAHILSQSVGHSVMLPKPPANSASTSKWTEGGVPIAARWHDEALVELRIGEVKP